MRALLALLLVPALAHADVRDAQGGAWLHYELTGLTAVDNGHTTADELVLAGARLHGLYGRTLAYHVGIDLAAGATAQRGGFAYDVALFPVGIGVRLGRSSFVALGAGIGAMGATGSLDDALTLPLEATFELGGGRVRLLGRARATYVTYADPRQGGATFADELEATAGVRIGHHYEEYGFPSGNGYFVAAAVRELMGARFVGLTIGYSIDLGTRR